MTTQLNRELWDRIATIFGRAVDAPVDGRAALLDQLCGSDLTIRHEVEQMLAAHERDDGLLAERRFSAEQVSLEASLAAGARVGPYRIISLIGAGGMGDVYRAERADGAYRQAVALKVLRPGYRTAELVRRFRIEREALARLAHPGIATILDGGALDDGRPYIVLELVDGIPITRYADEHHLGVGERLALFLKVTATVQFAHGRLVVHRDLKPSNILVQPDGTPRLLDFGIAKLLDPDGHASLAFETTPEIRLLTPEYAAPEQLRGEPPSTATDVYGLGVLLFELLTGHKPITTTGLTPGTLERAILEAPVPAPSSKADTPGLARRLKGDLDRIVLKALRKEPERRYLSAAQLGEDIERYLTGHPVLARPDSVGYRVHRFVARNRALVVGGVTLTVLLAGVGVTETIQARRIAEERDRTERERIAADDVVGILTRLFERGDPDKYPGGDTLRVSGLLDEAERQVDSLGDDPARQGRLWAAIGRMRTAQGDYPRALDLLGKAYTRQLELAGSDDADAARIHHELALTVSIYHGERAARPMLDSSLAELRRLLGDEAEEVRTAFSDLLIATTDSTQVHDLLAQLLALERRAPSRDPVAMADRLDARGGEQFNSSHYAEAAELYRGSLALLQGKLPPDHVYIRTERRNLALALAGTGQLAVAESLERVAVTVEDRVHGSALTRAMAREALAITLGQRNHADSAEQYEREALELLRGTAGEGNWRVWSAMRNLAIIISARGRTAEGLALLDSAIALDGTDPASSESVGYLTAQRIPFLLRLHRLPEAKRSLDEAERRLGQSPSVSKSHRADVNRYAGMVDLANGDAARAADRFQASLALIGQSDGSPRAGMLNSCLLGIALVRLGRGSEAASLLDGPCSSYESRGLADSTVVGWIKEVRSDR